MIRTDLRDVLWYHRVFDSCTKPMVSPEGFVVMTIAVERRQSIRHELPNQQRSVQHMDWTGPRIREATLVNISSEGALLSTDQPPMLHQPIRVRLEIAKEIGWISAIPVRSGQSNEVGVRFFRRLPLYFLRDMNPEGNYPPG